LAWEGLEACPGWGIYCPCSDSPPNDYPRNEVGSCGNLSALEEHALTFNLGAPYHHRDKVRDFDGQGSCAPKGTDGRCSSYQYEAIAS